MEQETILFCSICGGLADLWPLVGRCYWPYCYLTLPTRTARMTSSTERGRSYSLYRAESGTAITIYA